MALLILSLSGQAQSLNGTYTGLELINFKIDTAGKISFYGNKVFPKKVYFHEVKVVIQGSTITINKSPVSFDSADNKTYSVSDGGFLSYKGKLTKSADLYIAKTRLVSYDYIGFSLFEPPKIIKDDKLINDSTSVFSIDNTLIKPKKLSVKEIRETHDMVKGIHGTEVFLPKGSVKQDYIIRQDKKGIWINNRFYARVNSKAL